MRVMGLDIGDKRIGVAISDPDQILASPYIVIERTDDYVAVNSIHDILINFNIKKVVCGLPLSLSGVCSAQTDKTKKFIAFLEQYLNNIDIVIQDERLSTKTVKNYFNHTKYKNKKRKKSVDAEAACIILQSYLDRSKSEDIQNNQ